MFVPDYITPGETGLDARTVLFEIYTSDGLWADGGSDGNYEAAFPTIAAGDIKISYDLGATWANATTANLVQQGKEAKYLFTTGEVDTSHSTAGGGGGTPVAIGLKFEKTNYRTQVFFIDFRVDATIAAIKAKTDNLPSDPADESNTQGRFNTIDTNIAAIYAVVDTEVAAIKAKTDQLNFTGGNKVNAQVTGMDGNVITVGAFQQTLLGILSRAVAYMGVTGTPTRTAITFTGGPAVPGLEGALVMCLDGTTIGDFAFIDSYDEGTGDAVLLGSGFANVPDATQFVAYPDVARLVKNLTDGVTTTADVNVIKWKGATAPDLVDGRLDSSIGSVQSNAMPQIQTSVAYRTCQVLAVDTNTVDFKLKGQSGGEANETLAGGTLVGWTIALENPARNVHDGSYPQVRQIIDWVDQGSGVGRATVSSAWLPFPTGDAGEEGDYQVKLWPASSTPNEITETVYDAVASLISPILGLLHQNSMVDNQEWDGTDLISFRLRKFADATALGAADKGHADDADGETDRWIGTVEYSAVGKASMFKLEKVL